jgi:hypothetical protein
MDITIITGTISFLAETGILYLIVGAGATVLIGRVALVPALRKVDAIIDCVIEKAEDGEISAEDAKEIAEVIKREIGEDFWAKLVNLMFAKPSKEEVAVICPAAVATVEETK